MAAVALNAMYEAALKLSIRSHIPNPSLGLSLHGAIMPYRATKSTLDILVLFLDFPIGQCDTGRLLWNSKMRS